MICRENFPVEVIVLGERGGAPDSYVAGALLYGLVAEFSDVDGLDVAGWASSVL
jgi:hypothetical protein